MSANRRDPTIVRSRRRADRVLSRSNVGVHALGYVAATMRVAAEGGPTEKGGNHPPLESYPGKEDVLLGVHLTRVPFSVHVTYYRYLGSVPTGISGTLDWVNFSFEYRF